ncbi:MAG: hypothetical protein WKF47_19335 [Geodermatophilaceae bacterium]
MTTDIVDRLEIVNVDDQHADRLVMAIGSTRHPVVEGVAIAHAGQRVGVGEFVDAVPFSPQPLEHLHRAGQMQGAQPVTPQPLCQVIAVGQHLRAFVGSVAYQQVCPGVVRRGCQRAKRPVRKLGAGPAGRLKRAAGVPGPEQCARLEQPRHRYLAALTAVGHLVQPRPDRTDHGAGLTGVTIGARR